MGNLCAGDGTHLLGGYCDYCSRLAGEGDELDLVGLMAWINMDDCADIAGLKALLGKRGSQDYSIVFVYHWGNLLERMGCDKPWCV